MALSDPQGILASPLTIVNCSDARADIEAVTGIASQNQVERIIVGLPLSMDGRMSRQAEKVKSFTQELSHHIDVPVEFRDERLSTVSAKRLMRPVRKNKKTRHDAVAAALILQGYLDERHP